MNDNFVSELSDEILAEVKFDSSDKELYAKLKKTLEERINSRFFLEVVNLLTPEQAARVTEEMKKDSPEPAKLFESLASEIPNFQGLTAQILTMIHDELVQDLSSLKL